jgi:voltage-gated potassium channel Kch
MISFFITIWHLIRAFAFAWRDPEFRNIFFLLLLLVVSGMFFYSTVEGWSLIDSLYFSVVTLATVGYGDLAPKTTAGKLFTIFYLFVGIGLFVAVVRELASGFGNGHRKRRRSRKDSETDNHPADDL